VAAARDAIGRLADGAPVVTTHLAPGACWVEAAPAEVDLVLDNLLRNEPRAAPRATAGAAFTARLSKGLTCF